MSILPSPDPLAQPETGHQSEGIYLSALAAYTGQPGALPGVSFWPRVGARLIDLIIHYVVGYAGGILFGLLIVLAASLRHTAPAALFYRQPSSGLLLFVLALLGSIMFEAVCEGLHGSTPGKLLLGMTVVQEDGAPCRIGSALTRSFAYLIDGLFFGLVGYFAMQKTPQQQRHGDEWAHTIVVRRRHVVPQNLRSGGQFVLAFFFAVIADAALIIIGLLSRIT